MTLASQIYNHFWWF